MHYSNLVRAGAARGQNSRVCCFLTACFSTSDVFTCSPGQRSPLLRPPKTEFHARRRGRCPPRAPLVADGPNRGTGGPMAQLIC